MSHVFLSLTLSLSPTPASFSPRAEVAGHQSTWAPRLEPCPSGRLIGHDQLHHVPPPLHDSARPAPARHTPCESGLAAPSQPRRAHLARQLEQLSPNRRPPPLRSPLLWLRPRLCPPHHLPLAFGAPSSEYAPHRRRRALALHGWPPLQAHSYLCRSGLVRWVDCRGGLLPAGGGGDRGAKRRRPLCPRRGGGTGQGARRHQPLPLTRQNGGSSERTGGGGLGGWGERMDGTVGFNR
ncbi:hypothetical protein PVAP13_6NG183603 [Panicum virgatum]|uniref:Uncharacterized protein n=1 Tax=Panicum virgatum TaxID=38727 RepID=A0A8T0QXV6_PANVG|nr:hypothetical protein PVAP13_6NG183603 [Panicum virgatum]